MALVDPTLPIWFKSNGFEQYSDILMKELGVEQYDDFRLLRDEKDANELLCDMSSLKQMDQKFKQKFKKEIMKIIENKDDFAERAAFSSSKSQPIPKKKSKSKQLHKLKQSKQPKTPPSPEKKRSLPKPSKVTKSISHDSSFSAHKKSRSVLNIRRKPKSKQKTLSPKASKKEKDKRSKTPTRKQRSVTTVIKPVKKRTTKREKEDDTYDIDSISLKVNKHQKGASSASNILSKSKHQKGSKSLSTLDFKKRKKIHKEEKNKARGGFTIHTNRRVRLDDGRIGIVKYKGRTSFGKSSEDWIGIVIEYGKGQHNGTVNGRPYFRCRDGKGIMVRPDRIVEDLGNPNTKKLDDEMKRGSEEIQKIIKETARKKKQERNKKKKQAEAAAAAKEKSNYGGDIGWKPAKFDDYKPDESTGLYQQKLMHSKTLLDKNKNVKAVRKKKVSEI